LVNKSHERGRGEEGRRGEEEEGRGGAPQTPDVIGSRFRAGHILVPH